MMKSETNKTDDDCTSQTIDQKTLIIALVSPTFPSL